ncbi:MAG: hypothetical protein ACXABY_02640 [Candidatus Thorarchaeota archaeon]|jgi:hypothetical protein
MLSVYVLSYDSFVVRDNKKLFVYKWVKVGWQQVKAGMTSVPALPEDKPGEIVRYAIEERGYVLLKVMGDHRLRELTDTERESDIVKLRVPRI